MLDLFRDGGLLGRATTPTPISDAMVVQGMSNNGTMGPGTPITPSRGYSVRPRAMDYPAGVNITTATRHAWGRTGYEVLRELMRAYDVAQMCKNHKIDELRSMEPLITPMDGFRGDGEAAVAAARAAVAFPDREHPYDEWLSLWLNSVLTFDSGPLYRRRNKAGQIIGLEVIDGSTIEPLVDENGRRPKAPAPAYQQIIKGQSSIDFTAEDIIYPRYRPQEDSPYGMAPLETVVMATNTDMRFQWHLLQMFTEGSIPGGFMEVPPDLSSPDQIAEWQDYWDATFMGDSSIVHKLIAVPNGAKFTGTAPAAFDPEFPKYLAIKVAGAFGVVPQDIGLTDDVNRATGETQTDTQFRVNTLPWVLFVEGVLTRYLQHDLGLPVQFKLNTGRDKEDRLQEAQAWKLYIESGMASADEGREQILGLPVDNERPVPRGLILPRQGFVPLVSLLAISGKVDPETKAPADDVPLPETPFAGTPGLMPDKLPGSPEFHRAPINPDEPRFPDLEHERPDTGTVAKPDAPVAKELTAGVTSGTGITGVDRVPADDDEDEDGVLDESAPAQDVTKELAKFRAFTKARAKTGKWRDFEFEAIAAPVAKVLNDQAREQFTRDQVTKDEPFDGADASPKAGTPSWRDDPPVMAPQHAVDLSLTDYWAPQVQASLMDLWRAADLENAITATQGIGDVGMKIFRDTARGLLNGSIQPSTLEQVLANAWADAYNAGSMAAKVQMGKIPTGWDDWKPGMTDANQITALGWKETLNNAGITLKGITDTTVNKLAYRIADGVNAGDPSDVIARSLNDVLDDPARAEKIAQTETARMLNNAATAQYAEFGVTEWVWVTSAGACSTGANCSAKDGKHFPVGENLIPAHPYCRCAASPYIEGH
ncbi:phage portal protein [Arthrobacter liuii]|nr:phage portal protein [Arthrobacter liuii]